MARIAPGIEQRGQSLRLVIYWKGERITETHPGTCDDKHLRRVIKRREWLLSRLRVGLPIHEDDEQLLSSIAADYFASLAVKISTLRSYRNIWSLYWLGPFGSLTPSSITTAMVRTELAAMEVSPKTKRNALAVLSSIMRHGDVNPNPCSPIRIKRGQKAHVDRYRPDELAAVLSRLEGDKLVYFTLLAATGMRPGEALALEWSDYDGERISVTKQVVRRRLIPTTKTNVARRVYLPTWARQTIDQHVTRFKGGYIFTNSLGTHHRDTDDFNAAWKKAHQKARVPYRIPYTLRHTRAAELLSQGCPAPLAARELGHSVAMFQSVYSEFIEEYSPTDVSVLEGSRHQIGTKGDASH